MTIDDQKKCKFFNRKLKKDFDAEMIRELMGHQLSGNMNGREPINENGFDFYTRKALVIEKAGIKIELDPDETMFLLNELTTMLSNDEEDEEDE